MQLSPYRVGVAGPCHTRLLTSPAFRPCCCSLALSGLGEAVASESCALNSGLLRRQFAPCVTWRTLSSHTAHERGNFTGNFHIPPDLVVDRWAADGESGSHHDFWFRHDVWTMLFHQIGERITLIISIAWYFTTKSDGICSALPRFLRVCSQCPQTRQSVASWAH